jgi:hypothetical protein
MGRVLTRTVPIRKPTKIQTYSDEDGIIINVHEDVDWRVVTETTTNEEGTDSESLTTATTDHQRSIPERYTQGVTASALDSLCCEGNYYRLLIKRWI